jgi:hypothetical protein
MQAATKDQEIKLIEAGVLAKASRIEVLTVFIRSSFMP